MDKRKMKKEMFAYLATYLQEYPLSDLSSQIRQQVIPGKQTDAAKRRYQRVQDEVIAQLFTLGMMSRSELSDAVLEKHGFGKKGGS